MNKTQSLPYQLLAAQRPTTRPVVRQILVALLPTDSDFNAFCLDHFVHVHERFSAGMDRIQKTNLLLTIEQPESVLLRLRERHQDDPGGMAIIHKFIAVSICEEGQQTQQQWEELDLLYLHREILLQNRQSTASIDHRLVSLKRAHRQGSQIQEGDILAQRYRLLEIIGRGGFAKVWHAFDVKTKRSVAVKILHWEQSDELRRIERFSRGARQMQGLDHPHVVRVLDGPSEYRGFHFFVMELHSGGDLCRAILGGRISQLAALQAILQIGTALEYAHRRGLIHRDVKPQNILLDDLSNAWLTDFDLVWAPDTTGGTHTGAMGTFLYAAPEAMENASQVDHRVDMYSLGMTTLFVLYGDMLPRKVLDARLLFIDELACSNSLKELLRSATALNPDERPFSVAQWCRELACAAGIASNDSELSPANSLATGGGDQAARRFSAREAIRRVASIVLRGLGRHHPAKRFGSTKELRPELKKPPLKSNSIQLALFSMFWPGLGQIVDRQIMNGSLWMIYTLFGYYISMWIGIFLQIICAWYAYRRSVKTDRRPRRDFVILSLPIIVMLSVVYFPRIRYDSDQPVSHPSLPGNLDFEEGVTGQEPPGWFVPSAIRQGGYRAVLTESNPNSGKKCVCLSDDSGRTSFVDRLRRGISIPGFGTIMQTIDAAPYRGKLVRLRASVRVDGRSSEDRAQLWMRVDRKDGATGFFDNMDDQPIKSSAWRTCELLGRVSPDAEQLNFGMMLLTAGQACLDSASLDVIGSTER